MTPSNSVHTKIEKAIQQTVSSVSPLGGGSIADVYKAELQNGSLLFVKHAPQHQDMFTKEANGLNELRKSNTLRIPDVLFADSELLILEYLPVSSPADREHFFSRFGGAFAGLHRHTSDRFGFAEDNYIGSTPQKNLPASHSWKEFFFVNRLEDQVRRAENNGYNDKYILSLVHSVERSIDKLIPDDGEPPALLHGDLWSGNFLCVDGDIPAVIDPAVYYGHREADLAMTLLFGGFHPSFYKAYNEEYPLNDEWERRMELYKLYHLFNHLNLFGESYYRQVYDTLKRILR